MQVQLLLTKATKFTFTWSTSEHLCSRLARIFVLTKIVKTKKEISYMEILGYEYVDKLAIAKGHLEDELYTTANPNARIVNGDFLRTRGDGDDANPLYSVTRPEVDERQTSTRFNSRPADQGTTMVNIQETERIFERGNHVSKEHLTEKTGL